MDRAHPPGPAPAGYKAPREVRFIDALPGAGKVPRRLLKDAA